MPVQQDATAVANRWAQNLAAATQKMAASVNSLTQSPTAAAAAAAQTWLARLNDPATLTKFQNSLNRVSLGDWQKAFIAKGIPRISQGAQQAIPKMVAFMQQWLPYEAAGSATVRAMPKGTLEDRINRSAAMIRYNHNFRRT